MEPLTPEQIRIMQLKIQQMERFDDRGATAAQLNSEKLEELIDLVNSVLNKHHANDSISRDHIRFNADYVGNITGITDKKLSSIVLNSIFPPPAETSYSHFTTLKAATNIIAKKELWLFNLLKNFGDDEFRLFYEEHGITGYQDQRTAFGIRTDYRSLMSELFALCLTSETNFTPTLWNYFGYGGTGVKLTFNVRSHTPDFRQVYYSDENRQTRIPLLADLFDAVRNKFGYPLNFTNISKVGAFYIHGKFSNEQEYRFLVKRDSDDYGAWDFIPNNFQNDISYIVLPFSSRLAEFKLTKVTKGPNCSKDDFDNLKHIIRNNYTYEIDIE